LNRYLGTRTKAWEEGITGEKAVAFFCSKMNKKFNYVNTCVGRILPMKDTPEKKA